MRGGEGRQGEGKGELYKSLSSVIVVVINHTKTYDMT